MVESLDGDRRSACLSFNLKMLFLLLTIEFKITGNLDDVEMFHFFHWAYLTSHPPPSTTIKPRPDQPSPAHCWKIFRPSPSDFVGAKMRWIVDRRGIIGTVMTALRTRSRRLANPKPMRKTLTRNLGPPSERSSLSVAIWSFSNLCSKLWWNFKILTSWKVHNIFCGWCEFRRRWRECRNLSAGSRKMWNLAVQDPPEVRMSAEKAKLSELLLLYLVPTIRASWSREILGICPLLVGFDFFRFICMCDCLMKECNMTHRAVLWVDLPDDDSNVSPGPNLWALGTHVAHIEFWTFERATYMCAFKATMWMYLHRSLLYYWSWLCLAMSAGKGSA